MSVWFSALALLLSIGCWACCFASIHVLRKQLKEDKGNDVTHTVLVDLDKIKYLLGLHKNREHAYSNEYLNMAIEEVEKLLRLIIGGSQKQG